MMTEEFISVRCVPTIQLASIYPRYLSQLSGNSEWNKDSKTTYSLSQICPKLSIQKTYMLRVRLKLA